MALGYSQVPGVDVFNTFAPIVKSITVRLLLALALYSICLHTNWMYLMLSAMRVLTAMCICNPHLNLLPRDHCFRSSPRSLWKFLDKYIISLHFTSCI